MERKVEISQIPPKGRFSRQTPGTWVPRPYDKILKRLGYTAIGGSLLLLLPLSAFMVQTYFFTSSFLGVELIDFVLTSSLVVWGILYILAGIAAVSFSKRRTPAGRRALRALCWAMVLLSAALSILLYNMDRQFIMYGFFGLVCAPPMLSCERRVG